MKMTVKSRIAAAFGITIVALAIVAAIAYGALHRVTGLATILENDVLPGARVAGEIHAYARENYPLVVDRIGTADAAERTRLDATIAESDKNLATAISDYEKTITTAEDRALYDRVRASYDAYATAKSKATTAQDTTLGSAHERFLGDVRALVTANDRQGAAAAKDLTGLARSAQVAVLTALIVAAIVAIIAGLALYRAVTKPLGVMLEAADTMRKGDFSKRVALQSQDEFGVLSSGMNRVSEELGGLIGEIQRTGIQVSTSATEIAATSREQQATANEIAATTAEIGATSREISATAKELSKTMSDVVRTSESAAGAAANGQAGISRMQETMQQIIQASAAVSAKLAAVNEKAGNISSVVTTITKVADQTNLLSLNAAIEAEKAGEYGRGFSVVASEIRRLADQTALATQDIEKTVGQMQSAVAAGVMGMEKFSDEVRSGVNVVRQVGVDLESIIDQVQTLTPAFESVNEGMQGQTVGAEQISEALVQLNEAAQQTAEGLRQSNAAIEQLNNVTKTLQQGVSRFTVARS